MKKILSTFLALLMIITIIPMSTINAGANWGDYGDCTHPDKTFVQTVAPSCYDGYDEYYCADCDYYICENWVEGTGHNGTFIETVAPSCWDGYDLYRCDVCGDYYEQNYVDGTGHNYTFIETVAPSCNDGYDVYYCADCDTYFYENYVDGTGHNGTFVETVAPSCYDGYDLYRCDVCGEYYEQNYVDGTGHNGTFIETVAPSCYDGYDKYYCNVCDTYFRMNHVEGTGHNLTYVSTVAPSCYDGYDIYYCNVCEGYFEDNYVDGTGHNWTFVQTIAPSCYDGYDEYYCDVCDSYDSRNYVEGTGHNYTFIETVAPSCWDGYDLYRCDVCGDYYEQNYVDGTGHNWSVVESSEPSCATRGFVIKVCTDCGERNTDYNASATGHSFDNGICTVCNMCEEDCIESEHEYLNFTDKTWVISKPGAKEVAVTFSVDSYLENGWDFVYIYDGNDTEVGRYTGWELAGTTVTVNSDTIKIRLVTDISETRYGFAVSDVQVVYDGTPDEPAIPDTDDGTEFSIQTPSRTTIRHNDGIVLHANAENLPDGAYIRWTADNKNFKYTASDDGMSLTAISSNNGDTTFYAIVYNADGQIIESDSVTLTSNAGFFQKIGGFFRSLFGSTKLYEY